MNLTGQALQSAQGLCVKFLDPNSIELPSVHEKNEFSSNEKSALIKLGYKNGAKRVYNFT